MRHSLPSILLLLCLLQAPPAAALLVGFHEQASNGANANRITVNVPAGTRTNDVMLAGVTLRSNATVTAPGGWTQVLNTLNTAGGNSLRTVLFYRVVIGAEPASYTWNLSASVRTAAIIATYRGVDTASPIAVSGGQANASSGTITGPGVTTPVANVQLVAFFSTRSTTTITAQASMDQRATDDSGGTGVTIALADEVDATAGASGNRTAAAGASALNIGQLVGLRPSATVPGPLVWYRMDEAAWTGAAGQVADSSGNGLNGTAQGGATTAAGVKCRAGSFTGSPTRVDIPYNSLMSVQTTLTVTGWIRPASWPGSDLMSFFSKDTNYEFHVAPNGQISWWWGGGTQSLFTANNTAPLNTWTFVAFVFTRGAQTVYLGNTTTAATSSVTGSDTQQLTTNTLKLQIGDDQDFGGGSRRWNGLLDDIRVYDAALTQAEVDAIRASANPCGVDHYRVQNNASGVNCQAESVTITAHDASHNPVTLTNSTTITVTAAFVSGSGGPGSRGDWSVVSGGGTLANGTADDGVATYTFAAAGESSVVLALKETWAQTVNIAVSDGFATDTSGTASADTGYNQNLTLNAAGFRFTDSGNNLIPNQVAGVSSGNLVLQAIQSSACAPTGACTGVCTAPPGFTGGTNVSIELASECVDPIACQAGQQVSISNNGTSAIAANNAGSVTGYTAKSVAFGANAQAGFTLSYPDVGAIRLHARYTIPLGTGGASPNAMTGASNAFVVKPFSFVVSGVQRTSDGFANPAAANAAGAAFIAAGEDFGATVTAVNAANAATPNYGREIVPEGARLISTLAGGLGLTANPSIANNTALGSFSAGAASGSTFSWGEVGIITLSAGVADGDYLGAGEAAVFTQSGNVGRFTPHHFVQSGASVTNRAALACSPASSFTYLGEGIGLQFTLTARNKAGGTTQNYATANSFSKLPTTPGNLPPAVPTLGYGARALTQGVNLTGRLDLTTVNALTWSAGQAAVDTRIAVARAASPDGPFTDVRIGIAPRDADGVGMRSSDFDLDVDGAGGLDHAQLNLGGVELRYGRLRVFNAVGSQLLDLPVPVETQYFSGLGFAANAADSCTSLAKNSVMFLNFASNLSACETQAQSSGTALSFVSGRARLVLSKPGSGGDGNAGSVDLKPRLSAAETGNTCVSAAPSGALDANLPYLQSNWGGAAAYDQNPVGRASFGQARSTPELIYFRENY